MNNQQEGILNKKRSFSTFFFQHGYLEVYVPADITDIRGADGIVEGGSARLTCEATGFPPPSVYWKREGPSQEITIYDRSTQKKRHGISTY